MPMITTTRATGDPDEDDLRALARELQRDALARGSLLTPAAALALARRLRPALQAIAREWDAIRSLPPKDIHAN